MLRRVSRTRASSRSRRSTAPAPHSVVPALLGGTVIVTAVALLGVAFLIGPVADARHPVVTVDGRMIDRTELRARIVLDRTLAAARATLRQSAAVNELIAAREAAAVSEADRTIAEDPVRAAIDGLVRDAVIRTAAARRGLAPPVDIEQEIRLDATRDFGVRVRVVSIGLPFGRAPSPRGDWPPPPAPDATDAAVAATRSAAADRLRTALLQGASAEDAVAGPAGAGWRTIGAD